VEYFFLVLDKNLDPTMFVFVPLVANAGLVCVCVSERIVVRKKNMATSSNKTVGVPNEFYVAFREYVATKRQTTLRSGSSTSSKDEIKTPTEVKTPTEIKTPTEDGGE
jgi:deoxyribodipyrimidine photolyase